MKKEKKRFDFLSVLLFVCFIVVNGIMIGRALFGLDITDEAYYIAEAKTVIEGNLPYAYNNSTMVGMTFIMLPFVWLFKLLSTDFSGYVLYMRFSFLFFRFILLALSYFTLRARIGKKYAACIVLFMSAYHLYSILNFSYNTIPAFLIFFIGVHLFSFSHDKNGHTLGYFICGILSGLAVFSNPGHSISIIVLLVSLVLFRTSPKAMLSYIMGGIFQVFCTFFPIYLQSGWDTLLNGFGVLFQGLIEVRDDVGRTVRYPLKYVIKNIWASYYLLWISMVIALLIVLIIEYRLNRNKGNIGEKPFFRFRAMEKNTALWIAAIVGLLFSFLFFPVEHIMEAVGACACFLVFISMIFFCYMPEVWYIGLPLICFAIIEAVMTTTNTPSGRFIHMVPSITVIFVVCYKEHYRISEKAKCSINSIARWIYTLPIITALLITGCEIKSLKYVYQDNTLPELNYQVKEGVYKGVFTTEQKGEDTEELERFIKNNTEEELIAFRDNVPVGYLFMNGKICDVRTWDCMQFSYNKNDPSTLYSYYDRTGNIPEKIIYVDYGRDEQLSIYQDKFLYNEFLINNYKMKERVLLNSTYKEILVYQKKQ